MANITKDPKAAKQFRTMCLSHKTVLVLPKNRHR